MQILKEKREIIYYKYLHMNKKSNVLSSNYQKQCKSNMTTYTRLKRKGLILQCHMQKKNAQILRTGLKHIPNATEN